MFKSSEGRRIKRLYQSNAKAGAAGADAADCSMGGCSGPADPASLLLSSSTSSLSAMMALDGGGHHTNSGAGGLQHHHHLHGHHQLPTRCSPRANPGWVVEPVSLPPQAGMASGALDTGDDGSCGGGGGGGNGGGVSALLRSSSPMSDSMHIARHTGSGRIISHKDSDYQHQHHHQHPHHHHNNQQQQHAERRKSAAAAAAIASLTVASVLTYALYHASIEALVDERTGLSFRGDGVAGAGGGLGAPQQHVETQDVFNHSSYGRAATWIASGYGDGGGDNGGDGGGVLEVAGWGQGVSVVTVSAWQSLVALAVGFVMSRFWKRGRRPEPRALSDVERTRRNRCLLAFAAAHLAGTGLEYHGYGVVGPVAAEVLRSTETAFFCLLSLTLGMQRPGLASVPTLLLALGLALAATPASGEFRVGLEGLRASLAANVFLAIRAIAAKTVLDDYGLDEVSALFSAAKVTVGLQFLVLLAVELPRAASGLSPRLLPHLWGVGVGRGSDSGGVGVEGAGGNGGWAEGSERARLACLLLANGLCLYGHVLALFGLLSRLSATMFAVSSGYVRASLVFVLLLSLKGSATGPRTAGMALATVAVVVHLYRTYARGRVSSSSASGLDGAEAGGLLLVGDMNKNNSSSEISDMSSSLPGGGVGSTEEGIGGSSRSSSRTGSILPLPQLPLFLREGSSSPGGGGGGSRGEDGDDSPFSPGSSRGSGGGKKSSGRAPALFVPLLGTRHHGGDDAGWGGGGNYGFAPAGSRLGGAENADRKESSLKPGVEDGGDGGGLSGSPSRFAWRWMGLRPTGTPSPPSEQQPQHGQQRQQHGAGAGRGMSRFTAGSEFLPPAPPTHAPEFGGTPAPRGRSESMSSSPDGCRAGGGGGGGGGGFSTGSGSRYTIYPPAAAAPAVSHRWPLAQSPPAVATSGGGAGVLPLPSSPWGPPRDVLSYNPGGYSDGHSSSIKSKSKGGIGGGGGGGGGGGASGKGGGLMGSVPGKSRPTPRAAATTTTAAASTSTALVARVGLAVSAGGGGSASGTGSGGVTNGSASSRSIANTAAPSPAVALNYTADATNPRAATEEDASSMRYAVAAAAASGSVGSSSYAGGDAFFEQRREGLRDFGPRVPSMPTPLGVGAAPSADGVIQDHAVGAYGRAGGGRGDGDGSGSGSAGRRGRARGASGGVMPPSPASSSSFSLNGFEVIDKEDMWN